MKERWEHDKDRCEHVDNKWLRLPLISQWVFSWIVNADIKSKQNMQTKSLTQKDSKAIYSVCHSVAKQPPKVQSQPAFSWSQTSITAGSSQFPKAKFLKIIFVKVTTHRVKEQDIGKRSRSSCHVWWNIEEEGLEALAAEENWRKKASLTAALNIIDKNTKMK